MRLLVSPRLFSPFLVIVASSPCARAEPPSVRSVDDTSPIRLVTMPSAVRAADSNRAALPVRTHAHSNPQLDAALLRAPGLVPLDAGFEDRGGLQVSTRVVAPDLRLPLGFQRVYAIPGDPKHFTRGDGAIFAVFPRSVYRPASGGGQPMLPPSTVFQFGDPSRDRWYGVTGVHQPDAMKVIRPGVGGVVEDGASVGMRQKTEPAAPAGTAAQHATEFAAPRTEECSVDRSVPFAKLRFGPASRDS